MIVNGKQMEVGKKNNVLDLVKELNLNPERVVVEIDKKIVLKESFEVFEIKEDNVIEVISFVGGG